MRTAPGTRQQSDIPRWRARVTDFHDVQNRQNNSVHLTYLVEFKVDERGAPVSNGEPAQLQLDVDGNRPVERGGVENAEEWSYEEPNYP